MYDGCCCNVVVVIGCVSQLTLKGRDLLVESTFVQVFWVTLIVCCVRERSEARSQYVFVCTCGAP